MTPLRSCVARPSIGTRDTVAQGSLHCKEHRELQMPRPQCTQVAPSEAGAQRSVAPSTSVDSPCSSSCSSSAEDSCKSGRFGRVDLKNRTEKRRNRHVWMNCRVIRDREAPGLDPGPPDQFLNSNFGAKHVRGGDLALRGTGGTELPATCRLGAFHELRVSPSPALVGCL